MSTTTLTPTTSRPLVDKTGFWPEDILTQTERAAETPADLLHSAAHDLNQRSGELLQAHVEEGTWGEHLVFDFVLTSPALDGYSYRLFKLRHKLSSYPAEFIFDSRVLKVRNREELEKRLRLILSDPTTRRAVSELAQYGRERLAKAA
nr:hypothetical protein [Armatimonas sp.]